MRHEWIKRISVSTVGMLVLYMGFIMAVTSSMAADNVNVGEPLVLKTQKDRNSYSLGVDTIRNYKRLGMDINVDLVIRGMKDADAGGKLQMTDSDIASTVNEYRSEMIMKQRGDKIIAGMDNKKEGEEFMAANKTKEGVVTLPNGLQYKSSRPVRAESLLTMTWWSATTGAPLSMGLSLRTPI